MSAATELDWSFKLLREASILTNRHNAPDHLALEDGDVMPPPAFAELLELLADQCNPDL
jgi:hypothetical protein